MKASFQRRFPINSLGSEQLLKNYCQTACHTFNIEKDVLLKKEVGKNYVKIIDPGKLPS